MDICKRRRDTRSPSETTVTSRLTCKLSVTGISQIGPAGQTWPQPSHQIFSTCPGAFLLIASSSLASAPLKCPTLESGQRSDAWNSFEETLPWIDSFYHWSSSSKGGPLFSRYHSCWQMAAERMTSRCEHNCWLDWTQSGSLWHRPWSPSLISELLHFLPRHSSWYVGVRFLRCEAPSAAVDSQDDHYKAPFTQSEGIWYALTLALFVLSLLYTAIWHSQPKRSLNIRSTYDSQCAMNLPCYTNRDETLVGAAQLYLHWWQQHIWMI